MAPPRPLVARRHTLRTGTLRYFEVCYADRGTLESVLASETGHADGRVVYCLPNHDQSSYCIPGIRLKSRRLRVTSVARWRCTIDAIFRSLVPRRCLPA